MKEDYLDVLWELQEHHSLFAQFWAVGQLTETDAISTAAIAWDEKGHGLKFMINPEYWAGRNSHDKAFIIGHECLHAYLGHGERQVGLNHETANIAQDIVINHMLVDTFGFDRSKLTDGEKYCWMDTCFKGRDDIEPDRCFEYYYQLLEQQEDLKAPGEGGPQTVDSHEFLKGISAEAAESMEKALEGAAGRMTPDEMEDFQDKVESNTEESDAGKLAGSCAGSLTRKIILGRIVKKRKWETIVEDVLGRFAGMERELELELWTRDNKRVLAAMDPELILPAHVTEDVLVRDRIDVWFFQDVSGSCIEYAERFFKAAASIPEDRFRLRGFCFDVRVHEVDMKKGEIKGGGGTSFQPMEDRIQKIMKEEGCQYPQAVFVITDGYGDHIDPEYSDRWHWFLTEEDAYWAGRYSQTEYIPPQSKYYELKNFE